MTKGLDHKKMKLIREIMDIHEEALLDKIGAEIEGVKEASSIWDKIVEPTKKSISVEELVAEQNYTPILADEFFKIAQSIEIEESIEELLTQLA